MRDLDELAKLVRAELARRTGLPFDAPVEASPLGTVKDDNVQQTIRPDMFKAADASTPSTMWMAVSEDPAPMTDEERLARGFNQLKHGRPSHDGRLARLGTIKVIASRAAN
jgi:hypothetical protein